MSAELSQRLRCAAAVMVIAALLALPALTTTARPAEPAEGPAPSSWTAVWGHLTTLVAGWFGAPAPDAPQRTVGAADPGNLGSTLDPDGLAVSDPGAPATSGFEDPNRGLGSTLDPDG